MNNMTNIEFFSEFAEFAAIESVIGKFQAMAEWMDYWDGDDNMFEEFTVEFQQIEPEKFDKLVEGLKDWTVPNDEEHENYVSVKMINCPKLKRIGFHYTVNPELI